MKKLCSLFLSSFVFLSSFAQIGSQKDDGAESNGIESASPFGAARSRYIHCGVCGKWHYAPTCNQPGTPTPTPIDGGVSLLLIAGAAYGAKRFRNQKQA